MFSFRFLFFYLLFCLFAPLVGSEEGAKTKAPSKQQLEALVRRYFEPCDCTKRMMELQKKQGEWWLVVLDEGLRDDSQKEERTEAPLLFREGRWQVNMEKAQISWQCWPGRGHAEFSRELCL